VAATRERFRSAFANGINYPGAVDWRDRSLGNELAAQMKLVATDVTVVVLKDTGHWVLEEKPKETTDALVKFL
jgi:pimeloyl-ACP methyl ester carboxylesterase